MTYRYFDRAQWGARTDLPRLGNSVARRTRREVHIHHTAAIDNDTTPNTWDLADALAYQRRLQTARPDLGLDIPYTETVAILETGDVAILEGRGVDRSGAHTAGHNTAGLGFSFLGNFELATPTEAITRGVAALTERLHYLRHGAGFTYLGDRHPAGREVYGHRDTKQTSCPGRLIFERLPLIAFTQSTNPPIPPLPPEEPEMYRLVKHGDGFGTTNGDPAVREWQEVLAAIGANPGTIDGKYGDDTAAAVTRAAGGDGRLIDPVVGAKILGRFFPGTPTTGAGYTKPEADTRFAPKQHPHTIT